VADDERSADLTLQPVEPPEIPTDPSAMWSNVSEVGTRLPLRTYLREVWRRREFAVTVPLGELRAQNQDTVLGQLWHLLNPMMLIGIYYFIFQVILEVESRRGIDNYLAFLTVGVITYNYTRSSMQAGARMIVKSRRLVQSINFPRAILPMSAMVSETISHLYALPVMFIVVVISDLTDDPIVPMWSWLLVIPALLAQLLFNFGLAMMVARLAFHFRDVQQFLPYALRLGMYASGVIIPLSIVPNQQLRRVLELNPVYNLIEMMRNAVLGGGFDPQVWLLGWGWALGSLVLGFWYFRRAENEYGNV
jgi:teichoic acid transport system permease protein